MASEPRRLCALPIILFVLIEVCQIYAQLRPPTSSNSNNPPPESIHIVYTPGPAVHLGRQGTVRGVNMFTSTSRPPPAPAQSPQTRSPGVALGTAFLGVPYASAAGHLFQPPRSPSYWPAHGPQPTSSPADTKVWVDSTLASACPQRPPHLPSPSPPAASPTISTTPRRSSGAHSPNASASARASAYERYVERLARAASSLTEHCLTVNIYLPPADRLANHSGACMQQLYYSYISLISL